MFHLACEEKGKQYYLNSKEFLREIGVSNEKWRET